MANPLFQTKSVSDLQGDGGHGAGLRRTLGPLQLTMLGIGAIIGTGIFALTGTAAAGGADHIGAGPAIVISFLVLAVACGLAALCYAEFASMIPISGSAYTYAYASFGELVAWIIGWDLILEYAVGNIAVAISWSGYFTEFLGHFNIHFPAWLAIDPVTVHNAIANPAAPAYAGVVDLAREALATAPNIGFPIILNLPAVLITFLITALLVYGVKESANLNTGLVFLKIGLILLFLFVGFQYVDFAAFWSGPANPANPVALGGATKFSPNGWAGIMSGSALIFFAYIGFDAVSTTAEEAKNPQRDLPIGMIASLIVCTVLYIAVSAVLTGMVPLQTLANSHPVSTALQAVGRPGVATIISLGASLAFVSVLLVFQYGQTRIFYSMSRDGLLPAAFSRIHPRFRTPVFATVVTGLFVAIPAGLIDINIAAELTNIGTLFAFTLVAGGVLLLRYKDPERKRGFRIAFVWPVALGCMAICIYLMTALTRVTWERFIIWLIIGLIIYFLYGAKHSTLRRGGRATFTPGEPETMSPNQAGDLLQDHPPGVE